MTPAYFINNFTLRAESAIAYFCDLFSFIIFIWKLKVLTQY